MPEREPRYASTIGKSVRVIGQLFAREDLYVEGTVEGAIESPKNRITVGPAACVRADILASEIIILGEVQGNVEASNKVDIRKSGKLVGDVTTERISIEDGSFFKGNVDSRKSVQGQFSPDGNWVAYTSDESGRYEVYLAPFPGSGGQRQVSSSGGLLPRWRPDGKELFFTATGGLLMGAEIIITGTELEIGPVRQVPNARAAAAGERARENSYR